MKANGGYYIPTQLYESLFLFLLFGVLTFLYFKRYNFTYVVYLIAYGAWRIFIEFFRADHRGEIIPGSGISPSQFQSILFILGGIAMLIVMFACKWRFRDPEGSILTLAEYKALHGRKKRRLNKPKKRRRAAKTAARRTTGRSRNKEKEGLTPSFYVVSIQGMLFPAVR